MPAGPIQPSPVGNHCWFIQRFGIQGTELTYEHRMYVCHLWCLYVRTVPVLCLWPISLTEVCSTVGWEWALGCTITLVAKAQCKKWQYHPASEAHWLQLAEKKWLNFSVYRGMNQSSYFHYSENLPFPFLNPALVLMYPDRCFITVVELRAFIHVLQSLYSCTSNTDVKLTLPKRLSK